MQTVRCVLLQGQGLALSITDNRYLCPIFFVPVCNRLMVVEVATWADSSVNSDSDPYVHVERIRFKLGSVSGKG